MRSELPASPGPVWGSMGWVLVEPSDQWYRAVFHTSPVAMSVSDEAGRFAVVNTAFCALLGRAEEQVLGQSSRPWLHPQDRIHHDAAEEAQHTDPNGVLRVDVRYLRPDGSTRWAALTVTAFPGPTGQRWTLTNAVDVTDRRTAEQAARDAEADLTAIAAVARAVQSGHDPRNVVTHTTHQLAGARAVALFELHPPPTQDQLVITASAGEPTTGITVPLAEPSAVGQVWRTGRALFIADMANNPIVNQTLLQQPEVISGYWEPVTYAGQVLAVLGATWDHPITGLTPRETRAVRTLADACGAALHADRLRTDLQLAATTDPLTGTLNRAAWLSTVTTTHTTTTAAPLAIGLLDLDHFKTINDHHGHAAGDEVLRTFTTQAQAMLRPTDILGRWGGDEFVLALPTTTTPTARTIIDRLRDALPAGHTFSAGLTTHRPGEPLTTTLHRADTALYDAKHAGRSRTHTR